MCSFVNIFIPTHIFSAVARGHRSGLLFGYHKTTPTSTVNFNITALLPHKSVDLEQLLKWKGQAILEREENTDDDSHSQFNFLGELCGDSAQPENQLVPQQQLSSDSYQKQLHQLRQCFRQFQLVLFFDPLYWPEDATPNALNRQLSNDHRLYSTIQLTSVSCFDKPVKNYAHVTIIYYDTRNFMSSQLLNRFNINDNRIEFIEFINESLKNTAHVVQEMQANRVSTQAPPCSLSAATLRRRHSRHSPSSQPSKSTPSSSDGANSSSIFLSAYLLGHLILLMPRRLMRAFVYFTSPQRSLTWNIDDRSFAFFEKLVSPFAIFADQSIIRKSTTVAQLKFRFLQIAICWKLLWEIPRRRISLSLGNVLSSVVIDTFLGVVTIVALHYYSTPAYWLKQAWNYADSMVDDVDRLLRVLQSMPAGLKLNRPLNMALSQFYLYHIYLWESYMDIIRPIFGVVMQAIFYCGLFGFTCILSLLSDIFSLVTIHIYCFYGYGCQLYGLQVSGISALWRLFRGKKYNQLRNRVDSYSYNNEQLFIGTILFTVLLFLLPTVFMYYLVFLVLRFLTLAVQEGLFFFIEHISSMPLYTLILWLFNSQTVSGRVFLEVINDTPPSPGEHVEEEPADEGHADQANHIGNNARNNNHRRRSDDNSNTPIIVRLRTKRVSLFSIITSRYDDMLESLQAYRLSSSAKQLTWNEFFQSILAGKLLHQNLSIGLSLLLFIGYLLLMAYLTYHSVSS